MFLHRHNEYTFLNLCRLLNERIIQEVVFLVNNSIVIGYNQKSIEIESDNMAIRRKVFLLTMIALFIVSFCLVESSRCLAQCDYYDPQPIINTYYCASAQKIY